MDGRTNGKLFSKVGCDYEVPTCSDCLRSSEEVSERSPCRPGRCSGRRKVRTKACHRKAYLVGGGEGLQGLALVLVGGGPGAGAALRGAEDHEAAGVAGHRRGGGRQAAGAVGEQVLPPEEGEDGLLLEDHRAAGDVPGGHGVPPPPAVVLDGHVLVEARVLVVPRESWQPRLLLAHRLFVIIVDGPNQDRFQAIFDLDSINGRLDLLLNTLLLLLVQLGGGENLIAALQSRGSTHLSQGRLVPARRDLETAWVLVDKEKQKQLFRQ